MSRFACLKKLDILTDTSQTILSMYICRARHRVSPRVINDDDDDNGFQMNGVQSDDSIAVVRFRVAATNVAHDFSPDDSHLP